MKGKYQEIGERAMVIALCVAFVMVLSFLISGCQQRTDADLEQGIAAAASDGEQNGADQGESYGVSLKGKRHISYLFPDENGFYRPTEPMTRRELADSLALFLPETDTEGQTFTDVPEDEESYPACAALKAWGLVEGDSFRPDEALTKAELFAVLSRITPPAGLTVVETGLEENADELVPRHEFARVLNAFLGRTGPRSGRATALLDVSPAQKYYSDMVEAAVGHTYQLDHAGKEVWITSDEIELPEMGFLLLGSDLYYVTSAGSVARDMEINGFRFDETGRYTSGDQELDGLVKAILDEKLEPDMDQMARLKTLYDHVVLDYTYLKRGFYEPGDSSWAVEAAKPMLSTRKGNCYSFAAAFCVLARAIGADASVNSGYLAPEQDRHGWVTIALNDKLYACDPELEWAFRNREGQFDKSQFMLAPWEYSSRYSTSLD